MKYEAKEKHSRRGNCLLNITYYKLRAGKHFAYYIISLGIESYRVGSAREIFNQALMILRVRHAWKTMRKKTKIVARAGLCNRQRCGSTMMNAMESNLPDTVWNVMQADYQNGAPGIDKSHRMICG